MQVEFSERRLISDAGLLVAATLVERLGLEELVNESVWLGYRTPGAALPGRKVMTLVHGMLAGADSIDDMDLLRAGSTRAILGHRVMAPSTLGTFLRAFTFGHVRQLDRVLDVALERAWDTGAGPGDGPLVIDVDSFIGEVHGYDKQGAGYGYTRTYGYHPIIATRADTGEVLHIRNRKGQANTQRGAERFVDELLARVRRAGHGGQIVLRADSGFENHKLMRALGRQGVEFSIGVKQSKQVRVLITEIPEENWVTVADYPETGQAQIAETQFGSWRLIVRRTRLVGDQAELWPDWRYHTFLTNRTVPVLAADIDHRDHASVELTIRDLKHQALRHFPSGRYHANSAWTVIAALAHNLARWTTLIGLPTAAVQTAATRRRQLLAIPGRLTRTSRRWTLRLPPAGPGRPTSSPCWTQSARSQPAPEPYARATITTTRPRRHRHAHPTQKTPPNVSAGTSATSTGHQHPQHQRQTDPRATSPLQTRLTRPPIGGFRLRRRMSAPLVSRDGRSRRASSCVCPSVLLEGVSDCWAKPRQIALAKLMVNRDPDEPRS